MNELAQTVTAWSLGTLLTTALAFGFFPTFIVGLLARIYPQGHPRRKELPAELVRIPRFERLTWTAEQLATVLLDAIPARVGNLRRSRSLKRKAMLSKTWKDYEIVEAIIEHDFESLRPHLRRRTYRALTKDPFRSHSAMLSEIIYDLGPGRVSTIDSWLDQTKRKVTRWCN